MSKGDVARNMGLDCLRALSVAVVLANHCFLGLFVSTGNTAWGGYASYLSASAVLSIEWLFVLSGYLIGTMMIRAFEKEKNLAGACRDFWLRRWFRTLPCYYLFLLINVALSRFIPASGSFDWSFFVFSQNLIFPEKLPHFFGESWSLAVDEWFYLLMPVLVIVSAQLLGLSIQRAFFLSALLLILAPFAARFIHTVPAGFFQWDAAIRRITVYHLDATGWGVLGAALSRWAPDWWRHRRVMKAVLGVIATLVGLSAIWKLVHSGWEPSFFYALLNAGSISLMGVGTLLLLPAIVRLDIGLPWMKTVVSKISLYSYTLYLSHFPLLFIAKAAFDLRAGTHWAVLMLVALLWLALVWMTSVLVFNFFEKPAADVREKITRRVDATPFGT